MTPIHWRRAVPGDEVALSLLGQATFLASFAFDHPGPGLIAHLTSQQSVAWYAAALADPDNVLILGETPLGAPVAYAVITPPSHPGIARAGDIELKRIYLLPGWQRGGNGSALLNQALDIGRERGANRMLLAVYRDNAPARAFYARHGFAQVGVTDFMIGDQPFVDLVLAREY